MAGAQERLAGPGEASEVRNLSDNAEARAQAEAAMYRMMVTPGAKRRGRGQRESAATTVRSSADGPRRNRNHQSKDSSANPAPVRPFIRSRQESGFRFEPRITIRELLADRLVMLSPAPPKWKTGEPLEAKDDHRKRHPHRDGHA